MIFSLPQTNHYHKVFPISFTPDGCRYKINNLNGNKVAVFTLNDVGKKVKIDFQIKLKPYSAIIDKNYKISDYSKNIFSPNCFINGQDDKIVKMSNKVVGKEKNLDVIIKNLYLFTRSFLTYGKPIERLYSYKQAIEERITDCGGFSTFLASLLASQNIPSRLVVGFIVKNNLLTKLLSGFEFWVLSFEFLKMHAWLEFMLPDKTWFPLDPSTGKFGAIPANRLVTSFGCDFNIKINNKNYQIDIFQNPIYI